MFGSELLTYLDSGSTKIAAGTSLFLNATPDTTGRSVCVIETPGSPAYDRYGSALPAMTRPRAQIVTRSTKAVGGEGIAASTGTRSLAQDMWELVTGIKDVTLSPAYYQRVVPLQDPFLLHHDEAGRAVFIFNIEALRTATTNA